VQETDAQQNVSRFPATMHYIYKNSLDDYLNEPDSMYLQIWGEHLRTSAFQWGLGFFSPP